MARCDASASFINAHVSMTAHHPHHCHHDHGSDEVPYGQVEIPAGFGRRTLLAGAGGTLMLAALPTAAQAANTPIAGAPTAAVGAGRASLITQGTMLVHTDMHNHTVMSDGDGSSLGNVGLNSCRD